MVSHLNKMTLDMLNQIKREIHGETLDDTLDLGTCKDDIMVVEAFLLLVR